MHPRLRRMFATALPERVGALDTLLAGYCTLRLDPPGRWPAADFRDAPHLTNEHHRRLSEALASALAGGCG